MNYFNTALIIGGVIALFCGYVVFRRSPKSLANRAWLGLNISSAIWSFGYAVMITTTNKDLATQCNLILHAAAIFIPAFYLYFILAFTDNYLRSKYILSIVFLIVISFELLNPTHLFMGIVRPKYIFNYAPEAGPLYIYFTLYFWVLVLIATVVIIKTILSKKGSLANQLKYILLSEIGFLGGGSVFFLTFNIDIPPYALLLFALYPIVIVYAIIRRRLMNVRLVITRSFLFSVLVAMVSGLFTVGTLLASQLVDTTSTRTVMLINIIVAAIVVITLNPLRQFLAKITDRVFFKSQVNYQIVSQELSQLIATTLDREELLAQFAGKLKNLLRLKKVDVLYCRPKSKTSQIYYSYNPNSTPTHPDVQRHLWFEYQNLYKFFAKNPVIAVREEETRRVADLKKSAHQRQMARVLDELEARNVEVVVPVLSRHLEQAFCLLGSKISGDIYDNRDINLLELLSTQLASALDKSRLYEEVQEFNLKLKKKVTDATKELREANERLRELDKAKTLFLSVASHQLRTPLSGIKGFLSMVLEGDFGKTSTEIRKVIDEVYANTNRLIRLVNTFLNVSRIEAGRLTLLRQPDNLVRIATRIADELQFAAKDKGLELRFTKPDKEIAVEIDSDKIEDVLINLVDNAIKYTAKGWVEIKLFDKRDQVRVEVSDTGQGLDAKEKQSLFNKFVRGKRAFTVQTDGSGLGLYIAKRLTVMHGGSIGVDSPGIGKGSTFWFELPKK